ncbi:hypothetical protein [Campylobacter hyointestinalis]|uniref:hypothetical protein n=1 Tax=Campylobacter hyointestinalis TaxID=198 RepID=UPI000DCDD5EA|nr:hypothetical protein [Campylobacter hyointestinalis]RAZ51196.1 hypothetical protein CHL10075_08275 [Campylobacter hyointestinalis subsp. lawsonii]
MDIKNAATPIYNHSMRADRALYDKSELTLLNPPNDFGLLTQMKQYHSDGATKGAYRSSLDSNFLISGLIQNTTGIFKGSVTDFDAKINWKNTANNALIDFNLALGKDFKNSTFSKSELENIGLNLKNMPSLGDNIDKKDAFNIFLYQNIDKYIDVDYAIKDTLNPGNYKKGDETQEKQIKDFVKFQLMSHWKDSPDSMEFIKNLTKDMDLNEVKLEENKTNNAQTKAQNEPQTDEKRTPIKGQSNDISTYSSKRQIYSDMFKRFTNLQNLDNTSITTLLNSIDKSNIKV